MSELLNVKPNINELFMNKKHATITEDDRLKINEQIHKLYTLKEIFKKDVDK